MAAEVMTAALARRLAERNLEALGITASPSDVSGWLSASPRDQRRLAMAWATYVANGDPEWKRRRR